MSMSFLIGIMNEIEHWWKHLGCYDREFVTNIKYDGNDAGDYLKVTDDWWDYLKSEEKVNFYEEFFSEE